LIGDGKLPHYALENIMGRKMVSGIAWTPQQRLLAGIGLALAFGFILLESIPGLVPRELSARAWRGIALQWFATLVVALIAFRGLGLGFRDLGIRVPRLMDWLVMVIVLMISVVSVGLVAKLFPGAENSRSAVNQLSSLHLPIRILLVGTAGICEEFLFRGYGIEVLARFTKDRRVAGLLALFFFGIAHAGIVGWTTQLIFPFLMGAFLTLLYLLRGNLVIAMVMHSLIDTIGIILVPLLNGR
jgi:membrane protease YdiL (CAAX protease family)